MTVSAGKKNACTVELLAMTGFREMSELFSEGEDFPSTAQLYCSRPDIVGWRITLIASWQLMISNACPI